MCQECVKYEAAQPKTFTLTLTAEEMKTLEGALIEVIDGMPVIGPHSSNLVVKASSLLDKVWDIHCYRGDE